MAEAEKISVKASTSLMRVTLIIVSIALSLTAIHPAFGQSSFAFRNYYPPNVDAPVLDSQGVRLEGPNYAAELWGSATPDSLTPVLTFVSMQRVILRFLSGGGAGYVIDPEGRPFGDQLTVLQVPPYSGLAWLQVRSWDLRLGVTYEDAVARGLGGYGESPLFSAHGSDPRDLLGTPAPLVGLQSFSLIPVVPEPTTWALLALGGIAVWLGLRRRPRRRV
jgi:hypothetical protein